MLIVFTTVYSDIFARVLFSRNLAYVKLRVKKTSRIGKITVSFVWLRRRWIFNQEVTSLRDSNRVFTQTHSITFKPAMLFPNLRDSLYFLYSLLRPFLYFTTNQLAQKFKFLANFITYLVDICNIYLVNH